MLRRLGRGKKNMSPSITQHLEEELRKLQPSQTMNVFVAVNTFNDLDHAVEYVRKLDVEVPSKAQQPMFHGFWIDGTSKQLYEVAKQQYIKWIE